MRLAFARVAEDVHGVSAVLDDLHLLAQHLAEEDEADVGLAEHLLVALGDGALGDPAHVVLVERDAGVEASVRLVERHVAVGGNVLLRHGRAGFRAVDVVGDVIGVLVVDGHAPLRGGADLVADEEDVGEHDGVALRPVLAVLGEAELEPALDDAVLEGVERDLHGLGLALRRGGDAIPDVVAEVEVQPLRVDGVDGVLLALEPVARQVGDGDVADGVVVGQLLPAGEQRRGLRAHVREDESAELLHGVARDLHLLLEAPVRVHRLLEGLLDALAGLVHHPSVVHAAQAMLFGDAVGKVDAAVGAEALDESERAGPVLVEDEVLAEDADGLRWALHQFAGGGDGVPVAAHEFAHGRARAHLGEFFVDVAGDHVLLHLDHVLANASGFPPSRE